MKIVATEKAPKALGPYSQGYVHNGVLYTAGQIAINPEVNDAIARAGRLLEEDQWLLAEYTWKEYVTVVQEQQGRIVLHLEKLQLLPAAMRRRVLRMAVQRCAGTLQNVGSVAIGQLERLAEQGETGKIL